MFQVQDEIKQCFKRLVEVLKSRERQLLRQVEAIHRQHLSLVQSNLELHSSIPCLTVNLSSEEDLKTEVLQFGKIEFPDNNCVINDAKPYKAEDYQEANKDHVSFDKELQTGKAESSFNPNLANQSIELNEQNVPSSSWDLNATELMNIQLIDEDLDVLSHVMNSETSLIDTNDSTLSSRCTENSIREENDSTTEERNEGKVDVVAGKGEEAFKNYNVSKDNNEHPKQVQQWLQQILVETETEPIVHEVEQFSEIRKSRMYVEFPLET